MSFSGDNVSCTEMRTSASAKEKEARDLRVKNGEDTLNWLMKQRKKEREEKRRRLMSMSRKRRKPCSPYSEDGCVSDDVEACSIGSSPSHRDNASPRLSSPPPVILDGYKACDWCSKVVKSKVISFKTINGDKSFCSEVCFTQCRRASFKRNKTCDWCKHVRHTVNYVDFQDGDHQLQFCSGKCLNQYKMNIFCRETQAHLDLHPHLQGPDSAKATKSVNNLITPDLWLRDCQSDSSPCPSPSRSPTLPPSPSLCVPSPLMEIKVSPPPTPPPGLPLTTAPPPSSANTGANSNSSSDNSSVYGLNKKVRKEIANRKKKLKNLSVGKESAIDVDNLNRDSKLSSNNSSPKSSHNGAPAPSPFFNSPPSGQPVPSEVMSGATMHRPPLMYPNMLPPFSPFHHRPPFRLPPPLLPINRHLIPPPPPPPSPQSLLPPPTVLIPYPVALPIPIPVPVPVPIPIPLNLFAGLKQTDSEKTKQPTEPSAESTQVKDEPISPSSSPIWHSEMTSRPVVLEQSKHASRESIGKQETVSTSCT